MMLDLPQRLFLRVDLGAWPSIGQRRGIIFVAPLAIAEPNRERSHHPGVGRMGWREPALVARQRHVPGLHIAVPAPRQRRSRPHARGQGAR